jgi:hypothetical protein
MENFICDLSSPILMSFDIDESTGLIEKIADEYMRSSDLIRGNLRGAIDLVKMTYGVAPHRQFVLEYLQNAIDAGAKRCVFKIYEDRVLVANDGSIFNEDNVKSLCSIAQSSKQPTAGYIGFIGIGAKSAFLLGERLEVHSGLFHFNFDSSIGDDKPWEVIPRPIDKCKGKSCYVKLGNFNTTFVLSKLNSGVADNLYRIFFDPKDDFYIDTRTLLFVPSEEISLEMVNTAKMVQRTITRKTIDKEFSTTSEKPFMIEKILLEEEINDKKVAEKWLVLSKNVDVDSSARDDSLTKLYRRHTIKERIISIAFLLDKEDNFVGCQGVVKFGVFSFMPLREMESGLNFLIHADFITEPGRATIASEARWNINLRNKIVDFILNDVCKFLKNNDKYGSQLLILIPSRTVGGFFGELTEKVKDGLRNSEIILTYQGYKKPSESLVFPAFVYELLSREDKPEISNKTPLYNGVIKDFFSPLPTVFKISGVHYLARNDVAIQIERLKIPRETLRGIGIYLLLLTDIITNPQNRAVIRDLYVKIIERLRDAEDYLGLFDYLVAKELENIRSNATKFFSNLYLLTESSHKRPLREVFAIPYNKAIEFATNRLILNLIDKFAKYMLVKQNLLHHLKSFVKSIGLAYVERNNQMFDLIKELEGADLSLKAFIESLKGYVKKEINNLVNGLINAIDNGRMDDAKDITRRLLEYFEISKDLFDDQIKRQIRFKVENRNEFRTANELLLPFSEEHKLKSVMDFMDEYIAKGCPRLFKYSEVRNEVYFPELAFYDNIDKERLLNFIKSLGCDLLSPDIKRKIVEAIGLQLVAIREWRIHGNEVREIHGRTHDLEVMSNPLCYIEVKSTHSTADEFEVELRVGQIDALRTGPNTRLYIITEALANPKLIIPNNDRVIDALENASVKIMVKELIDPTTIQENILSWDV